MIKIKPAFITKINEYQNPYYKIESSRHIE